MTAPDKIDALAARLRAAFATLAPERIDTPALQPMAPYIDFLGEGFRASIVEYPSDSTSGMCLRPDHTLAIALDVITDKRAPGAFAYDDLVFRGDQAGAVPEAVHRQVGVELFGAHASTEAEPQLIRTLLDAADACGAPAFTLTFADIGLVHKILHALDLSPRQKDRLLRSFSSPAQFEATLNALHRSRRPPAALEEALAGLTPERAAEAIEEIFALANVTAIGERTAADIAGRLRANAADAEKGLTAEQAKTLARLNQIHGAIDDALPQLDALANEFGVSLKADVTRWKNMLKAIGAQDARVQSAEFDAHLGRGLSYYDGLVFELRDAETGHLIGGGGRYDSLVSRLSNGRVSTPAIGAMLRPDRLTGAGNA